ncbi:MAG: AbrB/MazE/SpoVT family DNA-binding domain-containing protein [Thiothrix sp.]|uniref:AbrB/MazE/SpoVT family DNA-binding domain-containing protein n=1 Tax=Thiothrix sp. TaxID=1032 RepID=UPI0026306C9C|nr:AbrB/MazE/SpoVT family DNA-binding domain-containing protein [Thiothrix sp.]MDD5394453.1 AbrB/MazE/SpoVT family DNA-binding domain-containing protein [Thiothrix sp.]
MKQLTYFRLTLRQAMQSAQVTHLSSKGQIVIPKSIRRTHQWTSGQQFRVEETPDGILLRPLKLALFPKTTLEQAAGCLKHSYVGEAKTLEEMEAAIRQGIEAQYGRG